MTITLPTWLRATLYSVLAVSAPVMTYVSAKGWVGVHELALYVALSGVVGAIALGHIPAPVDIQGSYDTPEDPMTDVEDEPVAPTALPVSAVSAATAPVGYVIGQ